MYKAEVASKRRQEFWTVFGKYMAPVLSSELEKINWINYKTGVKDIFFRMKTGRNQATVGIEITSKDLGVQQFYFEQFLNLKYMFLEKLGSGWNWCLKTSDEDGRVISQIYKKIESADVLNREDWPRLISFFKSHILLLDSFWNEIKYSWQRIS